MRNRILILGVASVQLDAILELKKLGCETYACAMAKDGPGADAADHFEEINIIYKEALIKHIIENRINLVYSVGSDLAIPVACSISEQLYMPHFVTEETARTCNNKNMMRRALGNDFKGNVNYQSLSNIDDKIELDYPFIIKPVDSQGQRGIFLVNNYDDYIKSFNATIRHSRSGHAIIERYIQGREISVNGYLVNGELKYLISSDRITWPAYIGLVRQHIVPSTELTSGTKNELRKIIESACEKLQISNGPVYAQMKLENGEPHIIEITPRLDGCHLWKVLGYYSGVNLLKLTFEHLLNNDTTELNNRYDEFKVRYILEFICQEPNTKADYIKYENNIANSIMSFNYYQQGDDIRPVNGKFEKIGYFIYQI
jgi:biotin carboxylase